jgi:hypothetical protein
MGHEADRPLPGDEAISPRILRHLRHREQRLKEDLGAKLDQLVAQLESRLAARLGTSSGAAAPAAGADLLSLRRDLKDLQVSVRETNRRIDELVVGVDRRFGLVLTRARAAAGRGAPTRQRDAQGRLVDELLIAVEDRRRLLNLTQRQLAEILLVDPRALSKWMKRERSTADGETRSRMRHWLDATDSDATATLSRLLGEACEGSQ